MIWTAIYLLIAVVVYDAIVRDHDWAMCILFALLWPIMLFNVFYDWIVYGEPK